MIETLLRLTGFSLWLLAAFHLLLPGRLGWKADFARVTSLNRQIFYVHCFFICLVLMLMGALCLIWPQTLLQPGELPMLVAGGLAIFWIVRLLMQFFVYDAAHWRGKTLETIAHAAFSVLWLFYSGLFGWIWWQQWSR